MLPLKMEEICLAVKGAWAARATSCTPYAGSACCADSNASAVISAVTTDTRKPCPGGLFVALRGERFDAHDFLAQAADALCVGAMIERRAAISADVLARFPAGVIAVDDTLLALGALAKAYRQRLAGKIISITGSNGKTTVKRMVHHILSRRIQGIASPKSFNNNIGVPLTLLSAGGDDAYVICETGTNAPGEIATLGEIAHPDIAVITSVSQTHLEKLIDIEHVASEKASLLGSLKPGGIGIVLADNVVLTEAVKAYPVPLRRFGWDASAEYRLEGYEPTEGGGRFQMAGRWYTLAVPGRHMASNAMAAVAVAAEFGFAATDAAEALADYRSEDMRLQVIQAGAVRIINDAYNANPASMAAGADAMASFPASRRVLVAGDMLELGPRSQQFHEQVGRAIAQAGVDFVIGVGKLGRQIARGSAGAGVRSCEIADIEQAVRDVPGLLHAGDGVLIKGSRGSAMERLIEPIQRAFGDGQAKR